MDNTETDIYNVTSGGITSDRTMFDNRGRFFDAYQFNKEFEKYIDDSKKRRLKEQKLRTHDLEKIENTRIRPYNMSFSKIIKNIQSMWFRYYDNIRNGKNILEGASYDDLFYLSITFITVYILYIMIYLIFS
jgi:hypothetical protein